MIEFRCTSCGKLLRTQAGTEGKKAKCPQCGAVLDIPIASQRESPEPPPLAPPPRDPDFRAPPRDPGAFAPPRDAGGFAPPRPEVANPYQSPGAYGAVEQVVRGFRPTQIELGATLGRTWEIFKANMGACIGGILLMMLCSFVVSFFVNFAVGISLAALGGQDDATMVVVFIVQQLVAQFINVYFTLGLILYMLGIARGEETKVAALFGGGPFLLRGVVVQILLTVIIMVGFVLLVVPGVILALMLSQAMLMLVDQRAGILDSLRLSAAAMKGNKLTVLGIWIVTGVLGVLVSLLTCFIGFIFVVPFWSLLMAMIYLGVTGQKTSVDEEMPAVAPQGFGAQPAGG
jgi:phage FluMu protein Com/uncharacterized membrane protein